MMLSSRITVAVAIIFYLISPGSSFFSSATRTTNVWHPDLVRHVDSSDFFVPRSLSLNRGFVPIVGPTIHRRISPFPFYTPAVRPVFVPVPVAPATEAPTLPPPTTTTTEAVTTTTAAATTLPPPPPPTTTAAPVEVETAAPPAIEEAPVEVPAAPEVVEAPAAPPAPQVITIQQPAAQGGFPQGIIAVQPIITHGGFLNIGDGGVSAPGGISQFSALLQALLLGQQTAPAEPAAAPAPPATEAPTTLAPAPETTVAPTLPPTTLAPPAPALSVHVHPVLPAHPGFPNIVLQPPQAPQVFQHQPFGGFINQAPANQQAPLPVDNQFLIRVEDAQANGISQEKRNLRHNGQNEYGYSVSHSHGQGGQSYSSYAQNNALPHNQYAHIAPGSASYGQQQLHPAANPQAPQGWGPAESQHVYSNQVHGAGGQFDYSYAAENHHSRGSRKYRSNN